jgi:aromatic-L-amino-acid/L-tryptophan decarboxylase
VTSNTGSLIPEKRATDMPSPERRTVADRIADEPANKSADRDAAVLGPLGDLPVDSLREQLHRMADWIAEYRGTIADRPICSAITPGDVASKLLAPDWDNPAPLDQVLRDLDDVVMPALVHWGHPAFLGYFGSTSNGPALLGEIAAAALNVSAMTWRTSPAATEMEAVTLLWIQRLIGLSDAFSGVVYDTASVATLHALAAARERCGSEIRERGLAGRSDVPVFRIYASDQAHSSVEKAAIVLGVGERNVIRVSSDARYRLDAGALSNAMDADVAAGMRPLAVVATIGTTSTASVDPVLAISDICAKHGAWLHVDAAYGGALGSLPEGRWAMEGADRADSIVVNPHKWLFVPLDYSALYTRHPEALKSVFSLVPEYLTGDAGGGGYPDYMDYAIQLGRRFRALKAWMVFRAFGRSEIVSRIREHCRLARMLAGWVEADATFRLAAPVTMGVVCFRYEPEGLNADATNSLNEAIVEAVNATGRAYVTHTRLRDEVVIRVGLGNVLTTEAHLESAWNLISSVASASSRDLPSAAR